MSRIDGYPAANALKGDEPFAMMQGGITKNATPDQLLAFFLGKVSDVSGTPGASVPVLTGVAMNAQGHLIFTRSDGDTFDLPPASATGVGFTLRGAWAASTSYAVGDLVTYQGSSYVAPSAFTSGSTFNPSNWQLIASAAVVDGATPDSLTAADPTTVGSGTVVVTIGGVDKKTTGAALVAGQGVTPDSLTAADPTAIGAGTLVVTVGTVDKKTTGAALVASQETTIDSLQVISAPSLSDEIAIWDVSAGMMGKVTLSALQALLGTTTSGSGGTNAGSGGTTSAPTNVTAPAISGTPQVGQTLTSSQGSWNNSPTSYAYQWNRAGSPISGATSSTYAPVSADVGNALTVTVTATNAGGSASATSGATAAVVAASGGGSTPTYPALVFDNGANTFDTTTPMEGAASFKAAGKGVAAITLNGPFCIELLVRGPSGTNTDNTGDWLHLVDSAGNAMGISTTNGCLRAQANGNGGFYDAGYPISNGSVHLVTLDYDGSQLNMTIDGGYHTSAVGATWVGGASQFSLYGGICATPTGVDLVRISDVSKYPRGCPTFDASTYTGARDANTIVCYNFNQQDGRGS